MAIVEQKRVYCLLLLLVFLSIPAYAQGDIRIFYATMSQSGSLEVVVSNVPGYNLPKDGELTIVVYDKNWNFVKRCPVVYINGEPNVTVPCGDLLPGEYKIEVYQTPKNPRLPDVTTEFWGGMSIKIEAGKVNTIIYHRHAPIVKVFMLRGLPENNQLSPGRSITPVVRVKNYEMSYIRVKIRVVIDRDNKEPYDYDRSIETTVAPGGEKEVTLPPFTPREPGKYYSYAIVYAYYTRQPLLTDQYWGPEFFVQPQYTTVKVTVQAIDGFGTVRNDWPVVVENVTSGMGQITTELVEGRQYVARVTGLGFTNMTTFVAKGPQMVIRVKIPTARIMAQAVDGFSNVRSEWSVQIDGVAAGQGAVGPLEVLSGRYTVRTWAFGREFSRSVEVSTGQVAVIQVRVPTARLTIAVFDDAGRQIDDLVTAVELAGPLTLAFSSPPKNLEVVAGTYIIKITGPGWEGVAQVTLQEGERKNIPIVIHGGVATGERRPETTEKASTNTAPPEGEFTWLVKISGDAFFWVFMIAVVGAIVIIVIRRRQ
jgi:hypothetical protein